MRFNTSRFAPPRIDLVANKSSTFRFAFSNHRPRFLEPVAHKIAEVGHAITIQLEQRIDVFIAQLGANLPPPRNGGLPTMTSAAGHSGSPILDFRLPILD